MTRLLLDFPASQLELALDPGSEPSADLLAFDQLCLKERLMPVPFIGEEQYYELLQLPGKISRRSPLQAIAKYVRRAAGSIRAMPVAGPNDLEKEWEIALHDELVLGDWRRPQIIIPERRRHVWRNSSEGQHRRTEARFRSENSDQEYRRVIAILESYDDHLYARSDRVPWDLQRRRVPNPVAPRHQHHPCSLPMPPSLFGVSFENLKSSTEKIRNWKIDGRYYFLPDADWDPHEIDEQPWRQGLTFLHGACPHCGKQGPTDRKKQVWCWDEDERHWDVQLTGSEYYWSISHDGTFIKQKRKSKKSKKGWRGRRSC